MSNQYIGDNCSNISIDEPWLPVSQVIVKVDDNHSYTAGTTTGRTMTINCPIGSQTVADNLLTVFSGFVYKAYDASEALIKPSTELGDAVSIGGIYSIVGGLHIEGDAIFAANLSAPSSGELDHEYPYDQWKRVIVDAKNIRHGGGHGTVSGLAVTPETINWVQLAQNAVTSTRLAIAAVEAWAMAANSVTNAACDATVSQSLADADYSADVFAGSATASWTKVNKIMVTAGGMLDIIGSATFKYGNTSISWKSKVVKDENGNNVTIHYLGY